MKIEFCTNTYPETTCDLLSFPLFEEDLKTSRTVNELDSATGGIVKSVINSGEFKAEQFQTCLIHRPRKMKPRSLLLIGAGKRADFNLASLREVAGVAVRHARKIYIKKPAFLIRKGLPVEEGARVCTEGAIYANFEASAYKTEKREGRDIDELLLLGESRTNKTSVKEAIKRGFIVGEATNLARKLANDPGNILTPSQFADIAMEVGSKTGLDVQVLEREDLEKLGMNTFLAVSRGSDEPPKLIILRIKDQAVNRRRKSPIHALVGKGVTFDSGGISIKPPNRMEDMKADMAGGSAVLGAISALAQLGGRKRVIGLIPAVENLPSGKATRPGDVVKSFLGKTVEIINTDAEGRLILADAIAYARTLGASRIIDIATLTGACIVALGTVTAGMMGTDQKTMAALQSNCSITGEKLWQLPLYKEYRKSLDSEIADFKNVGPRWGGAITAAKFLQEFVEDTPWVHLDIAGLDLDHDGKPFACKGATGFGVRTLVQLLS